MTDPNSSLLAQFDPIYNPDAFGMTPARLTTINGDETFTMTTFFNSINTQHALAPSINVPNNRGSLIDISINFEETGAPILDELAATKHCRQQSSSNVDHTRGGAENIAPQTPRLSPRKPKDAYTPPASPKDPCLLTSPSKLVQRRRSSLDLPALTLDIKHRLAAENMNFDILRDEISFLTGVADEEHSLTSTPSLAVHSQAMVARTAGQKGVLSEVAALLDSTGSKRPSPNLELALPPPPSLPLFDFENGRASSSDVETDPPKLGTFTRSARRPRTSVFDGVENTPTASANAEIPNIVTSWDDRPRVRPLSVVRPSRHLRSASSAAAAHSGSDAMFKVPHPIVRPSTRSPPDATAAPRSPEKPNSIPADAEMRKRASSLRTIASSIINKDRVGVTKASRTGVRVDDLKTTSSSSTGTLLRRSKTTISSGPAKLGAEPVITDATKKPRPSSLMLRRTNGGRPSQPSQPSEYPQDPPGASGVRGRRLEPTALAQTITSQQPSRAKGERLMTEQYIRQADIQCSNRAPERTRASNTMSIRSKFASGPKKDEQRGCGSNRVIGNITAHEADPEPRITTEHAEGASGLVLKRSHRGQSTASLGTLRGTETSAMQLSANAGVDKEDIRSRRTETPDDGSQDTTAAATRSTKAHSRAMQRPRLDGLKEWVAGVEAATGRPPLGSQSGSIVTEAQPKLTSGVVRKRSLKELTSTVPSSTAASSLRRTSTTAHLNSELNDDGPRHCGTSSRVLRPRTSIYSLSHSSKMVASVEVLPLAAPVPYESNSSATGIRSRANSIYSSKMASASTSAVNEQPRQPGRTAGMGTTSSASRRPSLLRRPSITNIMNPAIVPPPMTSTLGAAKSLSLSLLRKKSRGQI